MVLFAVVVSLAWSCLLLMLEAGVVSLAVLLGAGVGTHGTASVWLSFMAWMWLQAEELTPALMPLEEEETEPSLWSWACMEKRGSSSGHPLQDIKATHWV